MPESRDRLSRSNSNITEMYIHRQTTVGRIGILPDIDDSERSVNRTTFRWGATPLIGSGSGQRIGEAVINRTGIRGGVSGRGLFGSPRTVNRRGGRTQNTPLFGSSVRRGRGGHVGSRSVLPSWYPRTPLRDITHVVRAVERRRGHLGDGEGSILGTPIPTNQTAGREGSLSSAQLEDKVSFVTPKQDLAYKTFKPSNLILTAIANQGKEGSELLTPQKKLLDSIDIVEKVVMEELNRLKRTPTAKKAEREKKVRVLMSMR